jgi:hypothetical protein
MTNLEPWRFRPPEEASLFNPPFICALAFEFLKNYSKDKKEGASLFLLIVALTIALHYSTRQRLPYSTVTPLFSWVQENEDLLIGLASRSKNLTPYIKEAVMFGMRMNVIQLIANSNLCTGPSRATFTKLFLEQTTSETAEIIDRTKFIGRWFAKSGSEISVAAALGVKP